MATPAYPTAPLKTDKMPPGIPFIIGNEAAERFSYYGMQSILVVFMTKYLLDAHGLPDHMSESQAKGWSHMFVSGAYFLPVVGAFLADAILGKYWTVLTLSIVYCFGHFALAMNDTRLGLAIGLGLIALGAGGIKPCVSAIVGDQFGASNQRLLPRVYSWFYFSINAGSAVSTLLIPWLLDRYNSKVAFGTPGIFMVVATIIFWFGRKRFVRVPAVGVRQFFDELFQREHLKSIANLLIIVPFAAMFWALWEQNFFAWVIQAENMDLHLFGHEWLASQIQTVNPVFILVLLPLFSYAIYPAINRVYRLTPLRKIGMGLFTAAAAFWMAAIIQTHIDAHEKPNIIWQILAFLVLTASEIMVSVTHLEFSYTQAPKRLKAIVMCMYLGAVSLGSAFTAAVNFFIENKDGTLKLSGAAYYYFFMWLMLGTAVIFLVVSGFYRGRTYIQDESATAAA